MQGRVKHLSPCVCMCVIKKHGCLLSYCSKIAIKINGSLPLGFAIPILRKMPTKSAESSVEGYSMGS